VRLKGLPDVTLTWCVNFAVFWRATAPVR